MVAKPVRESLIWLLERDGESNWGEKSKIEN
jgi:hypothetical protein